MRNTKNMHEILDDISIAPSFEKENVVRKYAANSILKKLLEIMFDPRIEWDLPSGMPPHKRDETVPPDLAYSSIAMEIKRFYIYFKPSPLKSVVQRESRYIEMLESLHYKETDLLIAIKDKHIYKNYPGLDLDVLFKVFPEVFYFGGIFERKEWYMVKVNGDDIPFKIITPSAYEKLMGTADFTNIYTGEVFLKPEEKKIIPPVVNKIVETTEKVVKKTAGRPKKK